MEIVLASNSPRRRELMKMVAAEYIVSPVDIDESSAADDDPVRYAVQAAVLKARTAGETHPGSVVIAADTVVAVDSAILGKPADRAEAVEMLGLLSGRRHRVVTGLALYKKDEDRLLTGWEITYVSFRGLDEAIISSYLDRNDFLDKAGAYAIQDVGDAFVAGIKGDYDNVVGFPVNKVRHLLNLFRVPVLTLKAEEPAFPEAGAWAVEEGRRYRLPSAVAGDTVRVQVTGEKSGVFETGLLELVTPSPDRVAPNCPHFGQCGGCLFQDIAYPRQLELKRNFLIRELEAGGVEAGILRDLVGPIVPSPEIYGYRNKMEYGFGLANGTVRLGLRERSGHAQYRRTIPLDVCPIFGEAFGKIAPPIMRLAALAGLPIHNQFTGEGCLRNLVVREGKNTGQLMAVLVTAREKIPGLEETAAAMMASVPGLTSFYHVINGRNADVVDFQKTTLVAGLPYIEEKLGSLTFRIRPQTFFQTNSHAAEALYSRIRDKIAENEGARVLGLYCGAGVLETFISSAAASVIGVDSLPENAAAACENAALNGLAQASFIPGRVEQAVLALEGRFDIAVVDPPRVGLSPKAMRHVLGLNIPRLIYVSCNPRTLGRDLSLMITAGYKITSITPFDFFPHTPHLETLVTMEK